MHLHKAPFPKVYRRGVPFQTAVPGVLLQNERSLMMNHIHLPLPFHFPIVHLTWQAVSGLPSFPLMPRGERMKRKCEENKELL